MIKITAIADRLHFLMDGREKYPWGNSIGLGKGTIDGMTRTGSIPGGDTLGAIHRCENARIDWIIDGRGTPYNVACAASDEAAAELLQEYLETPGWQITIVTDGKRIALLLDQVDSFDVKDGKTEDGEQRFRAIEYAVIELIVGQVGRLAMDLVRPHPFVYLAHVDAHAMTELERGRAGTWRLLSSPDAIVKNAQRIDAKDLIYSQFNQQELFPATKDEAVLLDHYRAMAPEHRSALNQLVAAIEKHGPDGELVKGKAS